MFIYITNIFNIFQQDMVGYLYNQRWFGIFFFIEIFFSIIKNIFTPFLYIKNIRPFHVVSASYTCYIQPQGKKNVKSIFTKLLSIQGLVNHGCLCADDILLKVISSFFAAKDHYLQCQNILFLQYDFQNFEYRVLLTISVMDLGTGNSSPFFQSSAIFKMKLNLVQLIFHGYFKNSKSEFPIPIYPVHHQMKNMRTIACFQN